MANEFCVYIPSVFDKEHNVRESKLFTGLLSLNNNDRNQTIKDYSYLKSDYFKNKYSYLVGEDDAGEPLLEDIIKHKLIDEGKVITRLNTEIGGLDKDGKRIYMPDTTENYMKLSKIATEFNSSNPNAKNYTAVVSRNENGISVAIDKNSEDIAFKSAEMQENYLLMQSLYSILNRLGLSNEDLHNVLDNFYKHHYENPASEMDNSKVAQSVASDLIKATGYFGNNDYHSAPSVDGVVLLLELLKDDVLVKRYLAANRKRILDESTEEERARLEENNAQLLRIAAANILDAAEDIKTGKKIESPIAPLAERVVKRLGNFVNDDLDAVEIASAKDVASQAAFDNSKQDSQDDKTKKSQKKKLDDIKSTHTLDKSAVKARKILQDSIDKAVKKAIFYTESLQNQIRAAKDEKDIEALKKKEENYRNRMADFLEKQRKFLKNQQFNLGIENYVTEALKEVKSVKEKLDKAISESLPLDEKARLLINCLRIIQSNQETIESLTVAENESEGIKLSENATKELHDLRSMFNTLETLYGEQSLLTFSKYLEKFLDHTITYGNKSISKSDIIELLRTAEKDTGFGETWLLSAADNSDIIIKLSDKALKASKERKRQKTLDITRRLKNAASKLPNSNTDFMFERHADGTIAGRYISDTNWTLFFENRNNFEEYLLNKYGKNPKGQKAKDKLKERREWRKTNLDKDGNPNKNFYYVDVEALLTPEQFEYYKTFMDIRNELISYLPIGLYDGDPYKAIQIQKDMWERIKSTSPTQWTKQAFKELKNSIVTRTDETMFGLRGKTDFAGKEMFSVPIYFVNSVDENDLSTDTVSTLAAFADMAINYDEMMAVADIFELGRDVMEERTANVTKNGKNRIEKLKGFGSTVNTVLTHDNNNFVTRYNELLKSQLYGRYMNDGTFIEGDNWEIKSNKAASVLNKISSLNQLALNGLAGFAAVGNDMINVESEALAGRWFNNGELRKADQIYLKELPYVLGETGKRIKTSKLSLFIEQFDVLHEYDQSIRDLEWDKGRIKKLMSSNSLYIFMHMGSHWGETRTALAQAQHIKILSDDGTEEKSLWDILTTEPIDPDNPEGGYKLTTIPGYTLTEEDITKYTRKFMGANERLFGAYNLADRNALQATAIGQLLFLYRKFMVPAFVRRYGASNYNLDLDEETEGYYRTTARFFYDLARDSKDLGRNLKMYWNELSEYQKGNIKQAINELSVVAVLSGLIAILTAADFDKKDNPWHKRFLAYMSKRMKTEAQAFTPFGVFGETFNVLKSPAASIKTLEGLGDVLGIFNPWHYVGEDAIIQSGRYKGHVKAYRDFMNSPFVPMNKTIWKMLHPEESLVAFR